ncbi:MAG TPA: thiamine-binding protein [Tepidimicrobium sp.]|nr:thiamine-binding protein [Tepidimicrobium sp.]
MNASVAIQVLPGVESEEKILSIVDEVIKHVENTGLTYYVGPFETTIEGEFEELMNIVKECQYIAVKAGAPSVMSYVKINFKPEGGVLTIDQKVSKHHK